MVPVQDTRYLEIYHWKRSGSSYWYDRGINPEVSFFVTHWVSTL